MDDVGRMRHSICACRVGLFFWENPPSYLLGSSSSIRVMQIYMVELLKGVI